MISFGSHFVRVILRGGQPVAVRYKSGMYNLIPLENINTIIAPMEAASCRQADIADSGRDVVIMQEVVLLKRNIPPEAGYSVEPPRVELGSKQATKMLSTRLVSD